MRRRDFIKKSVIGATGVTLLTTAGITACTSKDPNRKIVLAIIGCGNRGIEFAGRIITPDQNVAIRYVYDVNQFKASRAAGLIEKAFGSAPVAAKNMDEILDDDELDAVIIATPEHWNALAAIRSIRKKKDVFVEANPSHCIWEGRKLAEAARKYKSIVQTGFHNRSAASLASAREFIQSGQLGPIVYMKAYNVYGGFKFISSPNSEVPQGLDWDQWLGPAGDRPYSTGIENEWSKYWDYSGGSLSVRASHVLDIARALAGDPGHPAAVYCSGGNRIWNSEQEVPEFQELTFDYGKFNLTCLSGNGSNYMKKYTGKEGEPFPDWFRVSDRLEIYGTKGLMYFGPDGGGWQVIGTDDKILAEQHDDNPEKAHFLNFIECMRKRTQPAADAEQGHLSASLVHLGNIAFKAGNKKLTLDASKETFVNNPDADKYLKKTYRKGFSFPDNV